MMTTAWATDFNRGRKSHLHGYFLSLVIEASLQETKGIQAFQISEGKSNIPHNKTQQNTCSIYGGWWESKMSFVNMQHGITKTVGGGGYLKWPHFPSEKSTWFLLSVPVCHYSDNCLHITATTMCFFFIIVDSTGVLTVIMKQTSLLRLCWMLQYTVQIFIFLVWLISTLRWL